MLFFIFNQIMVLISKKLPFSDLKLTEFIRAMESEKIFLLGEKLISGGKIQLNEH